MANDKIKKLLMNESDGKNISRRELAMRMKLPPQSINNWIDSDINPNDASLKKIARYFNTSVASLMDDSSIEAVTFVPIAQSDDFTALVGQAGAVLQSGTIYADALKQNIKAFYCAVNNEKKEGKCRESG